MSKVAEELRSLCGETADLPKSQKVTFSAEEIGQQVGLTHQQVDFETKALLQETADLPKSAKVTFSADFEIKALLVENADLRKLLKVTFSEALCSENADLRKSNKVTFSVDFETKALLQENADLRKIAKVTFLRERGCKEASASKAKNTSGNFARSDPVSTRAECAKAADANRSPRPLKVADNCRHTSCQNSVTTCRIDKTRDMHETIENIDLYEVFDEKLRWCFYGV